MNSKIPSTFHEYIQKRLKRTKVAELQILYRRILENATRFDIEKFLLMDHSKDTYVVVPTRIEKEANRYIEYLLSRSDLL